VYFEAFETPLEAIIREKQIKDMNRDEKLALVRKVNPTMRDLSEEL
jgi:predicted GIY-YIG superfamily endonuclease